MAIRGPAGRAETVCKGPSRRWPAAAGSLATGVDRLRPGGCRPADGVYGQPRGIRTRDRQVINALIDGPPLGREQEQEFIAKAGRARSNAERKVKGLGISFTVPGSRCTLWPFFPSSKGGAP